MNEQKQKQKTWSKIVVYISVFLFLFFTAGLCSQARTVDPCVDDSGLGEIDRVIREACSSKEIADEDICDATMALGGSASQASLLAGECSSRCFAGLLEDPQLGSIAVGRPYLATIDVAQPMCHLRLGKSCISKPRNRCPLVSAIFFIFESKDDK